MIQVSVKQARNQLSSLLDRVEAGEKIEILRRGKKVAYLSPPGFKQKKIPSLKDFRSSIRYQGKNLSQVVLDLRKAERY